MKKATTGGLFSLVGQALPALRPATRQHFAAVTVRHSFSKAVLLFSVKLLRLIRSQHEKNLLSGKTLQFSIISHGAWVCQ